MFMPLVAHGQPSRHEVESCFASSSGLHTMFEVSVAPIPPPWPFLLDPGYSQPPGHFHFLLWFKWLEVEMPPMASANTSWDLCSSPSQGTLFQGPLDLKVDGKEVWCTEVV